MKAKKELRCRNSDVHVHVQNDDDGDNNDCKYMDLAHWFNAERHI